MAEENISQYLGWKTEKKLIQWRNESKWIDE